MPSRDELQALLARVKAATGPSLELNELIGLHVPGATYTVADDWGQPLLGGTSDPYTGSVDHALALIGRALPGWGYVLMRDPENPSPSLASVSPPGPEPIAHSGTHTTPALALLAALIEAKIAETDNDDH